MDTTSRPGFQPGSADDIRPSLGVTRYSPDPQFDLVDMFLGAPLQVQLAVAFTAAMLLSGLLIAIYLGARRLFGKRKPAATDTAAPAIELDPRQKASEVRRRAERITYTIGGFGSTVSLSNSLYAVRAIPDGNPVVWATFIAIAIFFELIVLMLFSRALANALERGRLGLEGFLLWVAAGAIAVFIWTKHTDMSLQTTAVVSLLTGMALSLYLRHEARKTRLRLGSKEDQVEDFANIPPTRNPIVVAWRWVVARIGLVEEAGYGVLAKVRRRREIRLAQLAYRVEMARPRDGETAQVSAPTKEKKGVRAFFSRQPETFESLSQELDRQLAKLAVRYQSNKDFVAAIKPTVAMLLDARHSLSAEGLAGLDVWSDTGSGSGTGGADERGTGSGSGAPSGSDEHGTSSGSSTGTSTNTTGTGTDITLLAEVERIREEWTTEERVARADYDTARAYATEIGRALFAAPDSSAKGAMRAYFLVMAAAGHKANGRQMRVDVTGDPTNDKTGAGRANARTWQKQLDAERDEREKTTALSGSE